MVLNEKETMVLRELQTQEQNCMDKYKKYSGEAKDPVLKDLFMELHKSEKQHHDSLKQVLSGSVPTCNCNDTSGRDYHPKATYSGMGESQDKKDDCFWRPIVLAQKKWYLQNITEMFFDLTILLFESY